MYTMVNVNDLIFDWDKNKNDQLKKSRSVCFEDAVNVIETKGFIEKRDHPNKKRYPNQKIILVLIKDYVYVIPCVEDESRIFFKTIFASRKETKKYLKDNSKKHEN